MPLPVASLGLARQAPTCDLRPRKPFLLAGNGLITKLTCVTGDTSQQREKGENQSGGGCSPQRPFHFLSPRGRDTGYGVPALVKAKRRVHRDLEPGALGAAVPSRESKEPRSWRWASSEKEKWFFVWGEAITDSCHP